MGRPPTEWSGKRKGQLQIFERVSPIGQKPIYRVVCDCGTEREMSSMQLRGSTISCGCYRRTMKTRLMHGYAPKSGHTRLYRIWVNMRTRCNNKNVSNWHLYGGAGIKVCKRWDGPGKFGNFLADMGEPPSEKHTIDRIDPKKGYSPGNVRWATYTEQNRRTSRIRLSESKAKIIRESSLTGKELARILRVSEHAISSVRRGKTWKTE